MMGIPRMPPKSPPGFVAQIRAVIQNTLEMKDAGYTNEAILAAFEKGMDAGKAKADAAAKKAGGLPP